MRATMNATRFRVSSLLLSLAFMLVMAGCTVPITPARPVTPLGQTVAPVLAPDKTLDKTPDKTPDKTIVVVGNGNTRVQANIAQINLGIEVVDDTVLEANRRATEIMEHVVEALASQRIAGDDVQPYAYNIYAERDYPNYDSDDPGTVPLFPEETVPIRYRVIHQIHAAIYELDNIANVIDAVTQAGGSDLYIYGTDFLYDDPESLEHDARQTAIADGRGKAEEIAALIGVELGPVISMSELIQGSGPLWDNNYMAPLWPGQLQFYMQLQITYTVISESPIGSPTDTPISATPVLTGTTAQTETTVITGTEIMTEAAP